VPAYWPGGVRHVGDVSPVCGFRMEQEKAGPDTARCVGGREGVPQAADTARGRVPMRDLLADRSVVVRKPL
jgi:hypothetical protein